MGSVGGQTIFNDSSTAGSATLVANGGLYGYESGGIFFNGASSGGTARVKVFGGFPLNAGDGYLAISGHQSGVTVGSIEGSGNVFLGANDLTVGTNNISTLFPAESRTTAITVRWPRSAVVCSLCKPTTPSGTRSVSFS